MELFECKTCKGTGKRYLSFKNFNKTIYKSTTCNVCKGERYFNWIDNILINDDHGFFVSTYFYFNPFETFKRDLFRQEYQNVMASKLANIQPKNNDK